MKESLTLIELHDISKVFQSTIQEVVALQNVSLKINAGESIACIGPSGSGKSTLLHVMGLLLKPSSGQVFFGGEDVTTLPDRRLSQIRSHRIGFVFQFFNLLPSLNACENIEVPLIYQRLDYRERRSRVESALEAVGMTHRAYHYPRQLSGGEAQRTAIARALVTRPSLILADEPTGNLDSRTGEEIMNILMDLHQNATTLILVTHDQAIARRAQRQIAIQDGRVHSDSSSGVHE